MNADGWLEGSWMDDDARLFYNFLFKKEKGFK